MALVALGFTSKHSSSSWFSLAEAFRVVESVLLVIKNGTKIQASPLQDLIGVRKTIPILHKLIQRSIDHHPEQSLTTTTTTVARAAAATTTNHTPIVVLKTVLIFW